MEVSLQKMRQEELLQVCAVKNCRDNVMTCNNNNNEINRSFAEQNFDNTLFCVYRTDFYTKNYFFCKAA